MIIRDGNGVDKMKIDNLSMRLKHMSQYAFSMFTPTIAFMVTNVL